MDQHEKDWIRLGQNLRNYQPPGDPAADFAALQQLQQAQYTMPNRRGLLWLGLGLLLLFTVATWLVSGDKTLDQPQSGPGVPPVATSISDGEKSPKPVVTSEQVAVAPITTTSLSNAPEASGQMLVEQAANNPKRVNGLITEAKKENKTTTEEVDFPDLGPGQDVELVGKNPVSKATYSFNSVMVTPIGTYGEVLAFTRTLPEVSISGLASPVEIEQQSRLPRITFGGGLSTHWRGDRFMSDTDQGIYVSLGLEQPLGQRFLLAGRVGYRGHNLNLRVFEDDKPWSHYEEKINEVDASGEEVEYTYLGIVDGYKGIEFSLLLQYQLNNRATLQAGGRYSLPSLAFRRTVHSSRDGDITADPSPYQFLANEQPLVKYFDYGALLGGQYRINNSLSFEAQLHLGMVDLIEDDGERMNRFNHSSSLSLGLRYRLN